MSYFTQHLDLFPITIAIKILKLEIRNNADNKSTCFAFVIQILTGVFIFLSAKPLTKPLIYVFFLSTKLIEILT